MKFSYLCRIALPLLTAWPLAGMAGVLCVPAVEISPNITSSSGFPPCPPGTVPSGHPISGAPTFDSRAGTWVGGLNENSVGGTAGMAGPAGSSRVIKAPGAERPSEEIGSSSPPSSNAPR